MRRLELPHRPNRARLVVSENDDATTVVVDGIDFLALGVNVHARDEADPSGRSHHSRLVLRDVSRA
jgi:hypothetical protein